MQSLNSFDVRSVQKSQIDLIKAIYKDDPFMQAERVSRHYGIYMESNFSTQMFRWVNDIIKFVDLTRKLEKIGIYDIEN